METRDIKREEQELTKFLLDKVKLDSKISTKVEVLNDGGMGTIKFKNENLNKDRKYNKDIIQVSYVDTDGVKVLITLTSDNNNELFELEFWKTDFSPLIEYPKTDKINLVV